MSRYNLARFNLNKTNQPIEFKRVTVEIIECVAGPRKFAGFSRAASETVKLSAYIRIILPLGARDLQEIINAAPELRKRVMLNRLNAETVKCAPHVSKRISLGRAHEGEILCKAHLGVVLRYSVNMWESVNVSAWLSCVSHFSRQVFEVIQCAINAFAVEMVTGEIEVTMRPGQELRIDSNVYTALLDGANVLHLYNGEWIFITPETIEVIIETGNGAPLTGEIIYREMFV